MPADKDDEVFEVVDANNVVIGTQLRGVVHKTGLLHRAVYCFVFNEQNQLLIQQRSNEKRVGAGQWDLSVAEHLSPGETYKQAVLRGLQEELGIVVHNVEGPLSGAHLRTLETDTGIRDCEFVESYRLDGYAGGIQVDTSEVQSVRWVSVEQVRMEMHQHPEHFTQWFQEEIAHLGWLQNGAGLVLQS